MIWFVIFILDTMLCYTFFMQLSVNSKILYILLKLLLYIAVLIHLLHAAHIIRKETIKTTVITSIALCCLGGSLMNSMWETYTHDQYWDRVESTSSVFLTCWCCIFLLMENPCKCSIFFSEGALTFLFTTNQFNTETANNLQPRLMKSHGVSISWYRVSGGPQTPRIDIGIRSKKKT